MRFKQAFYKMRYWGASIKLPEWEGYWKWENDTIMMYCKDGRILDIRETEDVEFTFKNIIRDDWTVVELFLTKDLTFNEAVEAVKEGHKVKRESWEDNHYPELTEEDIKARDWEIL